MNQLMESYQARNINAEIGNIPHHLDQWNPHRPNKGIPKEYHSPIAMGLGDPAFLARNIPTFSPLDLPGILSWYDASDSSTITESAGRVSQFDDKAGSNDLVQATGGNQPLVVSADRNGLDVIDFVGSRWMDVSFTTLTFPVTIFMSLETPINDPIGVDATMYDGDTTLSGAFYKSDTANRWLMFAGTGVLDFTEGGLGSTWSYLTTIWNNTASKIRFSGTEKASGTASVLAMDGFTVASRGTASNFGNYKFGEAFIVDGLSTAQEISDAESYLATKWNI